MNRACDECGEDTPSRFLQDGLCPDCRVIRDEFADLEWERVDADYGWLREK